MALRHTAMAVGSALLVAVGSLLGATAAQATTFADGGLTYTVLSPTEVTIGDGLESACVGQGLNPCGVDDSGVLTIPTSVTSGPTTYTVTRINDRAFMSQSSVLTVTIPDTITHIGAQAFYQGTPGNGLSSLTLGSGLTTIGNLAFAGTAIEHLDVPLGVTSIGGTAFASMPVLETVEIGASVTTIGAGGFSLNPKLRYARFRGPLPTSYGSFGGNVFAESGTDYPFEARYLYYTEALAPSWATPPTESDWTWNEADVPSITAEPADTTASAGDASATFSLAASGNGDLYYQWQKNGDDLPGENSSTLTVPSPSLTDSGDQYNAVVSNWVGSQTSAPATLTVLPAATPPSTKSAQSAEIALAKKLKLNRAYPLPTHTAQGQPISWRTSKAGKCKVKGGKLKCRESSGKRKATLTATAVGSATLLEFTQTVRRKVG